jgi:WXG100 family type VII secretion target
VYGGRVDRLTVDFAVLGELVDRLAAHIDATDGVLADVDQIITDLAASWTGQAQEAFRTTADEWRADVRDLRDELHRIREFVVTAHGNHATAVETNVRIWRV